jgi:hypothetical protein
VKRLRIAASSLTAFATDGAGQRIRHAGQGVSLAIGVPITLSALQLVLR